jgi:hypothetical protein
MLREMLGEAHDVQVYRRFRLVRAYRKHRRDVEDRRHVEWSAALLTMPPKPKYVRDAKGRFACR